MRWSGTSVPGLSPLTPTGPETAGSAQVESCRQTNKVVNLLSLLNCMYAIQVSRL